jgi:hypothetical protein
MRSQILALCPCPHGRLHSACSEQSSRPPERLPSKNASARLNLRGRFSIPKLPITQMEMFTNNDFCLTRLKKADKMGRFDDGINP